MRYFEDTDYVIPWESQKKEKGTLASRKRNSKGRFLKSSHKGRKSRKGKTAGKRRARKGRRSGKTKMKVGSTKSISTRKGTAYKLTRTK